MPRGKQTARRTARKQRGKKAAKRKASKRRAKKASMRRTARRVGLTTAERPPAPDAALRAQASLRRALAGARLEGARLERLVAEPRRAPALRLTFSTPRGPRALIAEPGAHALLALLGEDQ